MSTKTALALFADLSNFTADSQRRALRSIARELHERKDILWAVVNSRDSSRIKSDKLRSVVDKKCVAALNDALYLAGLEELSVLVCLGTALPSEAVVRRLLAAAGEDPHFGFAAPRVLRPDGIIEPIAPLPGLLADRGLTLGQIAQLPERYILPEHYGSIFLIRADVTSHFGLLPEGSRSFNGALLDYVTRARRAGFRFLVANRLTAKLLESPPPMDAANFDADRQAITETYPDVARAREECMRHWAVNLERLCSVATSSKTAPNTRILLDIANLEPRFNGTTNALLGFADGLAKAGFDATLIAYPHAIEFHHLSERYPRWRVTTPERSGEHAIGIRASQPWSLRDIVRLHDSALVNIYTMYDTISWDILYNYCPDDLEETWNAIAQFADGLAYISRYTRERFRARFPVASGTREFICHLPLSYKAYAGAGRPPRRGNHILIAGNQLDHKWVSATLDQLARIFPFKTFKALGMREASFANVTTIAGGDLDDAAIDQLYRDSSLVIIPSWYEGFGFPMLEALARGKMVFCRDSAVVREIAARYRGPGKVAVYRSDTHLADLLDAAIAGRKITYIATGSGRGSHRASPGSWEEVARNMMRFADRVLRGFNSEHWARRERAVRQLKRVANW